MILLTALSSLLLFAPSDTLDAPLPDSGTSDQTVTITTGTPHTLSVSGVGGGSTLLRQPAGGALLLGMHLAERGDKPCRMTFFWWRDDNDYNRPQGIFETDLNICGNNSGGFQSVVVGSNEFTPSGNDHRQGSSTYIAAHGLRVCLNNRGDRIKGIRLFGSTINQDNSGEVRRDPALQRDFERTNCNTWKPARRCSAGEVIVGVVVHHDGDEIHGLAPKCAAVTVQS